LSLFDSTCIIVGIIIGASIYETAPTMAESRMAFPNPHFKEDWNGARHND
jgi:hypothetical protein